MSDHHISRDQQLYSRPKNIDQALAALAAQPSLVICGGTDVFPAHVGRPLARPVVDVSAVEGLREIRREAGLIRFGGATTWSDIVGAKLPPAFDGLKAAAREVGSIQIQNRGTIAGNLCNASPAADGVPPLLALDASVELASVRGRRVLPLSAFITGYRQTALALDEILSAVLVPEPPYERRSAFRKLGARRYLVISIVMAAAVIEKDEDGRIVNAAVAVGAASAVAQRLLKLEADLLNLEPAASPSSVVTDDHLSALAPIDDVRATAAYRREAARLLVGEVLDEAAGVNGG